MSSDPAHYALPFATEKACAAQHLGPWMIEPRWFAEAIRAVSMGTWQPEPQAEAEAAAGDSRSYTIAPGGTAILRIVGQMQKGYSKFGGTSTISLRRQLREAAADEMVNSIILAIDSPGGTVAGTSDLADEIAATDAKKPTYAYIEDLGASAAYWAASQTRHISANTTGEVGSIGVIAVVEDDSKAHEQAGIKVHVIATGPYKGSGAPGVEVTDDDLAYLRERVDRFNGFFLKAVKRGRGMPMEQVREAADGRIYIASQAQSMGLIDAVEPFDALLKRVRKDVAAQPRRKAAVAGLEIRKRR